MFQFKQFSILQDKSAMKVGTDGVLLGAWTPITSCKRVLDVGTGTGLISLMMTQRNSQVLVDAIEIEEDAYNEALLNFKNAPWSNRLECYHTLLQEFDKGETYDLIVSNPPYFTDTYQSQEKKRNLARHVKGLSFNDLLFYTEKLLSKNGGCSFIIPYKEESNFIALANTHGLYLNKLTRVKGREGVAYKRSLLFFKRTEKAFEPEELIIEKERHVYTLDYIKLTQSFYLKM